MTPGPAAQMTNTQLIDPPQTAVTRAFGDLRLATREHRHRAAEAKTAARLLLITHEREQDGRRLIARLERTPPPVPCRELDRARAEQRRRADDMTFVQRVFAEACQRQDLARAAVVQARAALALAADDTPLPPR